LERPRNEEAPSPLRSAGALHSSKALDGYIGCVFVVNLQAVDLEIVNRFNLRRLLACPRSTTRRYTRDIDRDAHKSMVHGI